jgi:hypothetical protein
VEPGPPLDLDDVILAWADLLPSLSAPARSSVQEVQPIRIEGDVVVFGVPSVLERRARDRFKREAETIRAELAGRVGRTLKFKIVVADSPLDPPGPASAPRGPAPNAAEHEPPPEDDFDPGDVVDMDVAPPAVSSLDLIAQQLDATIVEERPREGGQTT